MAQPLSTSFPAHDQEEDANASSSSFSSDDEEHDALTEVDNDAWYHQHQMEILHVEEEKEEKPTSSFDPSVIHACCLQETSVCLQPQASLSVSYDAFAQSLHHLRCHWPQEDPQAIASYRSLRAQVYACFQKSFPLTCDQYAEWIDDEIGHVNVQKRLFQAAQRDYGSVVLAISYLQFLKEHDEAKETIEHELKMALQSLGGHFTHGHELWQFAREYFSDIMDEHDAFAKETMVRDLYCDQMELPLALNDLVLSEFRAWNNYNTMEKESVRERAIEDASAKQQALAPIVKKLQQLEAKLQDPGENPEQLWLQYLNLIQHRVAPVVEAHARSVSTTEFITSVYERAVAMVCLSAVVWIKYWKFLQDSGIEKPVLLAFCTRAIRNVGNDANLWIELLLGLEHTGVEIDEIESFMQQSFFARRRILNIDASHAVQVLLTYCDVYRRHAVAFNSEEAFEQVMKTFDVSIEFMTTEFPEISAVQLVAYKANCVKWYMNDLVQYHALWKQITMQHKQNANVWLRYLQALQQLPDSTIETLRNQVFEPAMQHVADYPVLILDAWIPIEREQGDLSHLLKVRELHRKAMAKATKTQSIEEQGPPPQPPTTKKTTKRKREEPKAKKPMEQPHAPASKRPKPTAIQSNDSLHTVFVCQLSKDATQEDLEVLFRSIPTLQQVRLVTKQRNDHVKSRGIAYVEFADEAGVEAALQLNGTEFFGKPLNIQRSNPPPTSASDGLPAKAPSSEELQRDGTWRTNPLTLYVGGLVTYGEDSDQIVTQDSLQHSLEALGFSVTKTLILMDKRGKPKNYGLVEFTDAATTTNCLESLVLVRNALGSDVTLKRSRFSIEEIQAQQQQQQKKKKPVKENVKTKSKKPKTSTTPSSMGAKLAPHRKPPTKVGLSSLQLVPTVLKKSQNLKETSDPKPKTQADFRRLLLNPGK